MLPIEAIRSQVIEQVTRTPVVISSPTGSGKSTQVPRWCAQHGRVLVVEPRRVACRSLATRVAELEGERLGAGVGYNVRDDRRMTDRSRIVFATPGVVLRMLAGDRTLPYDTVIVDELHERQLDVDLIVALLRQSYKGQLIVMSATIDGDRVATYLSGVHLSAEGRTFPVSHHYVPGRELLPTVNGLEGRLKAAIQLATDDPGDILVFLPGKGEISACSATLSGGGYEVLTLHGGLTLEEQSRIFRSGQRRRIILSTNVAETSLTIPGVGVVIDSGLVRQTRYFGGRGFLMLVPVAMDSADQRAGRAGRMSAGVCYRLWSAAAVLERVTPPEIHRESLVPLILAAAACGTPIGELPFLDPPKPHAVEAATAELAALSALEGSGLSERGRRLFGLPIDSHLGRLLVEAETQAPELMDDVVDLVAALGVGRPLFRGARPEDAEDDLRRGGCDAVALIRAVREGDARRHGLSSYALTAARAASRRLRKAFGLRSRCAPGRVVQSELLARLAMAADPRVAHVRRDRKKFSAWSNGGTEIGLGRDSAIRADDVPAIAVLDTHALVGKRRDTTVIATCALPIKLKWMCEAGLGRERLARLMPERGRVVGVIERVYAKRVIGEREDVPSGQLARDAITELILAGRVLKGSKARLLERLAQADLYCRLVAAEVERPAPGWQVHAHWSGVRSVPDREKWLLQRLQELGVESGADLALLGVEDVIPESLPEDVIELLERKYPLHVSLGDARYSVEYDVLRRSLTLHQVSGAVSKDLPPLSYLPSFKGFAIKVERRGKVRELRRR